MTLYNSLISTQPKLIWGIFLLFFFFIGYSGCSCYTQAFSSYGECGYTLVAVCGLSCLDRVGTSWTRDRTCVPCIGRWILSQ